MLRPAWIDDGSEIPDPLGHGEAAVQWLRMLRHPKSRLPGRALCLDPWQERIIRRIYGPRHPDGSRIVRRVVLLLPRGNRKTALCALITLLHLMGPERGFGNRVFSAAASREQARELYREAALIVTGDPQLGRYLSIKDYTSETLLLIASTSGRGQENIAWQQVERAIRIQKGEIDDPATLPVIFMAEPEDDWQDEAVWRAVNPGLDYGYPDLDAHRDKARLAEQSVHERDSFLQFNLT